MSKTQKSFIGIRIWFVPSCIPGTYMRRRCRTHYSLRPISGDSWLELIMQRWNGDECASRHPKNIHPIHIKTSIIDLFDQVCARNRHHFGHIAFFPMYECITFQVALNCSHCLCTISHFGHIPFDSFSCAQKFNRTGNYQDNVSFFKRAAHPFIVAMGANGWNVCECVTACCLAGINDEYRWKADKCHFNLLLAPHNFRYHTLFSRSQFFFAFVYILLI